MERDFLAAVKKFENCAKVGILGVRKKVMFKFRFTYYDGNTLKERVLIASTNSSINSGGGG